MVKISSDEKENQKKTQAYKDKVLGDYNITLYDDEECKILYDEEMKLNFQNSLLINLILS